jgi:hypothetical protein
MPRERKQFVLRRITMEEETAMEELRRLTRGRQAAAQRVRERYEGWCRINRRILWTTRSLQEFLGVVRHQLSPGSLKNHARFLLTLERQRGMPPERIYLKNALIVSESLYARKGTVHVPDFANDKEAMKAVANIGDDQHRAAAYAMLLFGLRLQDLRNLERSHITITPATKRVVMDLHLTKNRRSVNQREMIVLNSQDLGMCPKAILSEIHKAVETRQLPFVDMEESVITEGLRLTVDGVTPGSLRRRFIHRVITRFEADDEVDWEKVTARTAHMSTATLKAFYKARVTK